MAGQVYFGNLYHQTWIKAPSSGMQVSQTGWQSNQQRLNGRAGFKRSSGSHRSISPSWVGSLNSESDSLQIVNNFATGFYGNGPFYWIDPFAMKQNLMPPHWATPALCDAGWPSILDSGELDSGVMAAGPDSQPVRYASITTSYLNSRYVRFIIPEGHKLHLGVLTLTGTETNFVSLKCYERTGWPGETFDYDATLEAAQYGTGIRTNKVIDGDTYSAVELSITSTCSIVGMIAQIWPSDVTPPQGDFISGRGTTGLEFSQIPTMEYYSANLNDGQIGMSASLIEVE